MGITIDIPDNQYRALMSNVEESRLTLSQLVQQLIEQGLQSSKGTTTSTKPKGPPPVIIPPRGVPIPATPREEFRRVEEEEDEAKHLGAA